MNEVTLHRGTTKTYRKHKHLQDNTVVLKSLRLLA